MAALTEGDEPSHSRLSSWRWAILAVYWLAMLTATHWPGKLGPISTVGQNDKVVHLLAFGLLAWLIAWCISPRERLTLNRTLAIAMVILVYAAADEVTQPLFYRVCDPFDWIADMVGGAIGLGVFAWQSRKYAPPQT